MNTKFKYRPIGVWLRIVAHDFILRSRQLFYFINAFISCGHHASFFREGVSGGPLDHNLISLTS